MTQAKTELKKEETIPFAITLEVGSSLENETGSWRTERPVYVLSLIHISEPTRLHKVSRMPSSA